MKLSCHNLTRKFGDTTALNGVNLCLDEPKIYGLLGRNGAGKTTLLRLITNYIQPTEGTITLDEQNVWENEKAQHQIFLVTETSYFAEMNAHKLIQLMSEIYPSFDKQQCLDYAKRFELDLNKKYTALSTGYKSVLRAVLSLSVHTPFLFLDEPTLGMDAFHRELFYKLLIESYSESPSCILLSTHLISEVEGLLENVIILDHGKVLIDESSEQLLAQGYCVSGRISDVDDYCSGKNVIGSSVVGGLKTTAVLGEREQVPDTLEVTGLSLQQLFVQLVGSENPS
ncbi:MAG: ATP-binding cassette domain-containing protein [Negativibacillus massiliensis]|uniref:ATP-binding cassette domain-containing protein n=1 Tax=Negativibacillus massiliensis TaxID=1871035 RepID=UPI00399AFD32|nr:ABC transporter ATP-binding protein [Clostridium sp.]